MPPISHVLYIPGILLIGIAVGFVIGAKAARAEQRQQEQRRKR